MATCAKCGATVPEDSLFCVECGEKVDGTPKVDSQETDKPKKNKKGLFSGLKKKKDKKDDILDAESVAVDDASADMLDLSGGTIGGDADFEGEKDGLFDSIEDEAKNWAEGPSDEIAEEPGDAADELPVLTPEDTKTDQGPEKRMVPKAVFIARNKNGAADKTFGLLIFAIIAAIIAVAFVFNPTLLNANRVIASSKVFAPLFLISLGGLLVARTGNIDLSLPAITVVTYFMLMYGRTTDNFYIMMILSIIGGVGVGLVTGVLSTIGKIPAVFTGLGVLSIALTYISTFIDSSVSFILPVYDKFTNYYVPVAIIILSVIAAFILIYLSRLGRPIYKRKGLITKDKLLFILSFMLAGALAAGGGIIGSIYQIAPTTMSETVFLMIDYVIGMLFIIAICGASTWFDNRVMPVIVLIIAFLAWFGIDIIISGSDTVYSLPLSASAIKLGFFGLALIGERIYTKGHLPEYHQTINVKR